MDGWADGLERACDESCYDALDNGLARTGVKDLWIFLMSCFGRDIGRKYSIVSKY